MQPSDLTQPARCWCGDTVTIGDDGYMCCGTDMFHDPCLPPLVIPPEQTACPEVLADRDGNCTACGKPILPPGGESRG